MNIDVAIDILESHNKWRRGGEGEMVNVVILGRAIDTIVEHYKTHI